MRAIFIAVGSELLEMNKIDTNSIFISLKLLEHGILTDMKFVCNDEIENLSWLIKKSVKRAQLLVISGGLGPTEDDITREAVSKALKIPLVFKEELVDKIKTIFKRRGIDMPEINSRQGFMLEGAEILENEVGSAPGQYIETDDCKVLLLPGPPQELKPMFLTILKEKIAALSKYFIYKRTFKFSGITESEADSKISGIYAKYKNIKTTILASPGVINLTIMGRAKNAVDEAKESVEELAEKIRVKMADYIVTEKELSFEEFIINELIGKNISLSVAESCTGGSLGDRITSVSGSSKIFLGGVISYSNDLKTSLLGVSKELLEKKGAVSKEVAKEMAEGIRQLTGSDIGISITGIAGPDGGTRYKPVGLVFMHINAVNYDNGIYQIFPGDRNTIKKRSVNFALNLIREYLNSL
jgi:nicotinamide-nucleotide amidase